MLVDISSYSERGIRKKNEDAMTVMQNGDHLLAVVADGLGGCGSGEIASAKAVQTITGGVLSGRWDGDSMVEYILQANREIVNLQTEETAMRTTVAVLVLEGSMATVLHVGDSRIYQIRDNTIIFQSVDHSMAQIAVTVGECPPDQLRTHPDQNKLYRSLGNVKAPKIDVSTLDVAAGDVFLLCSDGFWGPVLESVMLRTLTDAASMDAWLGTMRETARRYSRDNHTALCLRITEIE